MTIRDRLSLQFTLLSALLLFVVLAGIYVLTAQYRRIDFRARLLDRAVTHAQLFLAEDNMSAEKFRDVQKKYPLSRALLHPLFIFSHHSNIRILLRNSNGDIPV